MPSFWRAPLREGALVGFWIAKLADYYRLADSTSRPR